MVGFYNEIIRSFPGIPVAMVPVMFVWASAPGQIAHRKEIRETKPTRIGRWWEGNEEIDIVALNEVTNEILFAEVKWSNRPVGTNIYEDLKRKAAKVAWGKKSRKEGFTFFSRSGFTPDMKKLARKDGVLLFEQDKPSK